MERVRAALARRLESGTSAGLAATVASRAWGAVASTRVARPLCWPSQIRVGDAAIAGVHVVAVGGATLGGSGKTPLAIACAAELAAGGAPVALVGHAYRATPGRPRVVTPDDDVRIVGDEALLAARVLASLGRRALVVVAPTRQAAIDRALSEASILVLDGVAQTSPRRASVALLSVDAAHPWGAAHCPPRGDLRAPVASLLGASDSIVTVRDDPAVPFDFDTPLEHARARHDALVVSRGAWLGPTRLAWSDLASMRVGLVTTLARPSRVAAFLERRGVHPVVSLAFSDHAPPGAARLPGVRAPRASPPGGKVDVWLTTAKCALQLECARTGAGAAWGSGRGRGWGGSAPAGRSVASFTGGPLAVIDYAVELSPPLARALHPTLCAPGSELP